MERGSAASERKQRKPRYGGPSNSRRSAKFKIGHPLEYRVARLLIHLGLFVRRGRELYTIGNLDQATDLDVFAVQYAAMFQREVQICECKDGREGPLDRVFWIAGVKKYVGATRATIIRKSTKWNIKDFASRAGVEIIDLPRLEELERSVGIDGNYWPSISNREFFQQHQQEWNTWLSKDAILEEIYHTLAGEVRFHEPLSAVSFLLHQARALTRELEEIRRIPESLTKFLLSDVVAHLAMFFMRISEVTFSLSERDRNGFIEKGLTYGNLDAKLTQKILQNARRIAAESVMYYTGRSVEFGATLFKMPEPPHVREVQQIVRMLVEKPVTSSSFGPMTDLVLSESYLKKARNSALLKHIFPYSDFRERLSLVQSYLSILRSIRAIPESRTGFNKPVSVDNETDTLSDQIESPGQLSLHGVASSPVEGEQDQSHLVHQEQANKADNLDVSAQDMDRGQ